MFNKALQYFVNNQQNALANCYLKTLLPYMELKNPDPFHRFRILDSVIYINVC